MAETTRKNEDGVQAQAKAADGVKAQAAKADELTERANQAAERAPTLDTDLEEVKKGADDPTSMRASAEVHRLTTEYAGAVNVGRPDKVDEVQEKLERQGFSVDPIPTGDSASLPVDVARAEQERSAAERRKVAEERENFAVVTGRRAPADRQVTTTKGTGKDASKVYPTGQQ